MTDRIRDRLKNQGVKRKAVVKTVKKTPVTLPKTVLNQVRDGMREASRGLGSLYFEARVTLGYMDFKESDLEPVAKIASCHDFRFEDEALLMCSTKLERIKDQLVVLGEELKKNGYNIWRYRISEVMMDSNNFDTLKLV